MKLNKKGFTLVELLVVVAIIGILASIVLVSLNSARDRARVASLQSTLASITTMANLCINDGASVADPGEEGNFICNDQTITAETWPDLGGIQGLESANYVYIATNDTTISAGVGTTPVISCAVATGSCERQ